MQLKTVRQIYSIAREDPDLTLADSKTLLGFLINSNKPKISMPVNYTSKTQHVKRGRGRPKKLSPHAQEMIKHARKSDEANGFKPVEAAEY